VKVWQRLVKPPPGMPANSFVRWRDGWVLPFPCAGMVDDPACPYQVELDLEVVEGRVECAAARFVQRRDGPPVSPRRVRDVPLTAYVKALVAELAVLEADLPRSPYAAVPPAEGLIAGSVVDDDGRKRGRRPKEHAHLEAVAKVFRQAEAAGVPARQAVQRDKRWGPVGPSTAARWVRAARDAGLLDEPRPRAKGQ
jgi:hypothetical protein